MHGYVDALALAALPRVVQCRERRDCDVRARDHEVQFAERLQWRSVDVARRGDRPTQRARDEIGGEIVAPGAIRAERGRFDDHQRWICFECGADVENVGAETVHTRQDDIRRLRELPELCRALLGRGVHPKGPAVAGEVPVPQ